MKRLLDLVRRRHEPDVLALSAWLDGELEAGRGAALEAHVAGCAACQERLEGLRAVRAQVGALGVIESPRSFRITPAMTAEARPERRAATTIVRWAPAVSAAAVVVFAVVVAVDVRSPGGGSADSARLTSQSAKGPEMQRAATASGLSAPAAGAAGAEKGVQPPAVATGAAAGAAAPVAPTTPTAEGVARKDAGPAAAAAAAATSGAAYDSASQRAARGGSGGSGMWLHIVEGAIAAVALAAAGVAIGGRRMTRGARQ